MALQRIKIFYSETIANLESSVNNFLHNADVEVLQTNYIEGERHYQCVITYMPMSDKQDLKGQTKEQDLPAPPPDLVPFPIDSYNALMSNAQSVLLNTAKKIEQFVYDLCQPKIADIRQLEVLVTPQICTTFAPSYSISVSFFYDNLGNYTELHFGARAEAKTLTEAVATIKETISAKVAALTDYLPNEFHQPLTTLN